MEQLNHQKRSRVRAEADFLPQLERGSRVSLEKQLVQSIREAIESGRLHPGMRLPSSRRLAAALQVNRNTLVTALEHLMTEDYLTGKLGSGTFVSDQVSLSFDASNPSWVTSPAGPRHCSPIRRGSGGWNLSAFHD